MEYFTFLLGFTPCLGFLFFFLTIVFAQILGVWGSRKWFLVALVTGFLSGFLLGVSVEIFGLSPGLLNGIFIGALVDFLLVGGGWLTRYYREIGQMRLRKMEDKTKSRNNYKSK